MLGSSFGRALAALLIVLVAAPMPLPAFAGGDPGVKCGASALKVVGKACSSELACHSKFAKSPAKDPGGVKLQACLAKNQAKLTTGLAKVRAKAQKVGAACALDPRGTQEQVDALGTGILAGMLTDWDPEAGDAVDDGLRSALLKAGGKVCSGAMAAVAKQTTKPVEDGLELGLAKPLIGFAKSAGKATAKAEGRGGSGIDLDVLDAVVEDVRATAQAFVPEEESSVEVFEVSSGSLHSCLLRTDGSVECWGTDFAGQASAPSEAFDTISAGGNHSCGIRSSDDRAECWGDDTWGQTTGAPTEALGFVIDAGTTHTCALRLDGTAVCWGDDSFGQLNPPNNATRYSDIEAGLFHTCGVRTDNGVVECWGDDFWGQSTAPGSTFHFRQVTAGDQLSCGIETDSDLVCWGSSQIPPTGPFFDVSAGQDFACGLSSNDFTAECWGVLGPWRAPPDSETFSQIAAGSRHTCAVRDTDSTVTCWGEDTEGQTSCAGVEGCTGAAPPPCLIARQGPVVGEAGRFTITQVLDDPTKDYRLILPRSHLDQLRLIGEDFTPVAEAVASVDENGFTCDGDDRVAIEFNADASDIPLLLHELGVLGPILDAIDESIVQPVKKWLIAKAGKWLVKQAFKCILRMLIAGAASACA